MQKNEILEEIVKSLVSSELWPSFEEFLIQNSDILEGNWLYQRINDYRADILGINILKG